MIKARMIGMAGGTIWLIAVSTSFAILSLAWSGRQLYRTPAQRSGGSHFSPQSQRLRAQLSL
jgi:hypothetical protein